MRRFSRWTAAPVAAALLLTGCGSQIGAAALVGGTPIPSAAIESQRAALSATPAGTGDAGVARMGQLAVSVATDRTLLTHEIWHELLAATGNALTPSNSEIDTILAGYADEAAAATDLAATADTLRERVVDTASFYQVVQAAAAAGQQVRIPSVSLEYVAAGDLSAARAERAGFLADPSSMAAALATATASGEGGTVSASAIGPDSALIYSGLFSAAPGEIVLLASSNQTLLVRIVSRTSTTETLDASTVSQMNSSQINALGAILLGQPATGALPTVEVNPRFGSWDPELVQVVAATAQL